MGFIYVSRSKGISLYHTTRLQLPSLHYRTQYVEALYANLYDEINFYEIYFRPQFMKIFISNNPCIHHSGIYAICKKL
jgi:hypothetical protein